MATQTNSSNDDPLEKAKAHAHAAAEKIGAMSSRNALVTVLAMLIPVLYLRIPTLLTMGYYRVRYGKLGPPRYKPRTTPMDQVLKEMVPEQQHSPVVDMNVEKEPVYGPLLEEDYEEEEPIDKCPHGLILLTGATGSVGSKAAQLLLSQGFCVRIFTESLEQAQSKVESLDEDSLERLEWVQGLLGDGVSVSKAFDPRETTGYASVTHVLFAAASHSAGNHMDAVHHRGVEECATAAARAGTVQSMVVMSAAWVSKPYSLASLLYNGMYDNLPSAKHWQGEDALRHIAEQQEQDCDAVDYEGNPVNNETSRVPLNYVILRSGRLVSDGEASKDGSAPQGIGLSQDDSFDFWGPPGTMSHSQLAQAAVAALHVEGKYTVEVSSGSNTPGDAQKLFSMLLQDDENSAFNLNQTVTIEDVEQVHAQAMSDFINVIFTLLVGTAALVYLLGPGEGLFLSMTLYIITILMWRTFLSNRTIWDCLASEMPRKLPLLHVPGVSFGAAVHS